MNLIGTVPRCHTLGATISIALILASAWVWSWGHRPVAIISCGEGEIELGEAMTLIENASQWREISAARVDEQDRINARVEEIVRWLPESVEFKTTEQTLLDLGEDNALHLFALQEGKRQVGSRVAVMTVTCEIHGSYVGLCRFLDQLPKLDQPIACSEVKLQRALPGQQADEEWQWGDQPCRASLTLRIPYAAPETASWKLLKEPTNDI